LRKLHGFFLNTKTSQTPKLGSGAGHTDPQRFDPLVFRHNTNKE